MKKDFLTKLNPQEKAKWEITESERFHPDFDIDHVPDIHPADLPLPRKRSITNLQSLAESIRESPTVSPAVSIPIPKSSS